MFSERIRILALAALTLAALAACQPLPKPFQPPSKAPESSSPLTPGADAGVTVVPIQGLEPTVARALGEQVAEGLRRLEIPASTRTGHPGSYILQGEASARPVDAGTAALRLNWKLIGPTGLVAGSAEQNERLPAAALDPGDAEALARLATRVLPRLEALIRADAGTATAAAPKRLKVAVPPVDGAPGDGGVALPRALRAILSRQQIEVAQDTGSDTYQVIGAVRMKTRDDEQLVEIDWTVLRPDGTRIGSVSQANTVPRGLLDGVWGEIAYAAAQGGAEGVLRIFRSLPPQETNLR